MANDDLLYLGFNSRVAALRRQDRKLVWEWKSPKGWGYAAVLLDRDQLFVSVNGYTYALDPVSGRQLWQNELPGLGTGIPCLATANGTTARFSVLAEAEQQASKSDSTSATTS